MKNHNIPVEYILLGNYIKYNSMQELTLKAFSNSNDNNVNIYIDLYHILLSIYKDNIYIENYSIITSCIINLCAHIRSYYRKKHGVETKIFIVYSNNMSNSNTQFYHDYNKQYRDRILVHEKMDDMVKNNLELLKILCPYLPEIYFVQGTFEPGVMIYNIICRQECLGNTSPSIIFSKSLYNYQIPAIRGNAVIFRSKKSDNARVIMTSNVLQEYILETRTKTEISDEIFFMLNSELLSLLITLTNFPQRNIHSLFNIRTAINILVEAIRYSKIHNGYNSEIDLLYNTLNEVKKIPIDKVEFVNRFKCIDLKYQMMLYMESVEVFDDSYLLDLIDDNTVKAINNEYFRTNPLDLNRL